MNCGEIKATSVRASIAGSNAEGAVHVPSIDLPLSVYTSADAKRAFVIDQAQTLEPQAAYSRENILAIRQAINAGIESAMQQARALFPADVVDTEIDGIPASVVTPKSGLSQVNRDRVLIELHPGAFIMGAGYGIVESIPIAALGRITVVSVKYRLTPENQFPAATEDVTRVFRALLREYTPQNIGIYGCSAGGLLAAESIAWFQRYQLPQPGAIGIVSASADARFDGDSRYTNPASGFAPTPGADIVEFMLESYFGDADLKDPMISPVWSQELLSRFPPTLIMTSTRGHELSSAVFTHQELVKAGAVTDLHVWDGLPHAFHLNVGLPESRELFDVIVKFFGKRLGSRQ
jgi:monoterpene epsilon-lactone hydrolase